MAKNTRIAIFIVLDLVCFNASYLLAYMAGASIGTTKITAAESFSEYFDAYPAGFLLLIAVKLLAMYVFSVYRIMFEFAGIRDFQRVALSLVASTLASATAAVLVDIEPALMTPVILFSLTFDMAFVLGIRLLYVRQTMVRQEREDADGQNLRRSKYPQQRKSTGRVMVIGVNRAAADLVSEMQMNESSNRKPEIIIDDEKHHDGDALLGIEIISGRNEIRLRARRHSIDEIIIAKPFATKRQIAALLRECVKTRCKISLLPFSRGNESAVAPPVSLADLRKPTIHDLLGRDRPRVDHRKIGDQIKGRVVLVTGGAGVFGSELCRRIIRYRPRRLIALDLDEDGLALLTAEMDGFHTVETEFRTVLASVRDMIMMRRVFNAFRPHIVFHTAELKQIPLAQANPRESFLTNVFGLKITCDLADEFAAEKFILCSTVRAAEPVSVAAECKRAAELYIEEKNGKSQTAYATVRFPNLIEGHGNVISIFEKQLEQGGPLTITDKDISRRFINVEEAALLTVLAAALAGGGETFELGPGEAISIRDLAEAMIRLAGKIPYEEVDIVVTQMRQGERLVESPAIEDPRNPSGTNERIWLTEDRSGIKLPHWSQLWSYDPNRLDDTAVMELLRQIFPTYKMKIVESPLREEQVNNDDYK